MSTVMNLENPVDRSRARRALVTGAINIALPLVVYAALRPTLGSGTLCLAAAGSIPVIWSAIAYVMTRQVDALALLSCLSFGVACLASMLLGGGSLPLKLNDAIATLAVGLVLVVAVLVHRPLPIHRVLGLSSAESDTMLGLALGGFLLLHSAIHIVLALTLTNAAFLITSKIVGWAMIGIAVLGLHTFKRHHVG